MRITPAEAAKYLGCGIGLVYKLCHAKRLAHYRLGAGRGKIVLNTVDLDAYLDSARVPLETRAIPTKKVAFKHLKL